MELSTPLRDQIWRSVDWGSRAMELEAEIDRAPDPWERSFRTFELAQLYEWLIPDRERALVLYQRAWRETGKNRRALIRARRLYRELRRLDMVAKLAEVEYKHTHEPETLQVFGEAWLDAGEPDKAVTALSLAVERAPHDLELQAALMVAQTPASERQSQVAALRERAANAKDSAGKMYLQAARLLRAQPESPAYEELLVAALDAVPTSEPANTLMEILLEKAGRWSDYATHHDRLASACDSDRERVDVYRRGGMALAVRLGELQLGSLLIVKALNLAYERGVADIPAHLAMLSLVRRAFEPTGDLAEVEALCHRALAGPVSEDERLCIALFGGELAWKSLGDVAGAELFLSAVKHMVPDHPLVTELERETGRAVAASS